MWKMVLENEINYFAFKWVQWVVLYLLFFFICIDRDFFLFFVLCISQRNTFPYHIFPRNTPFSEFVGLLRLIKQTNSVDLRVFAFDPKVRECKLYLYTFPIYAVRVRIIRIYKTNIIKFNNSFLFGHNFTSIIKTLLK